MEFNWCYTRVSGMEWSESLQGVTERSEGVFSSLRLKKFKSPIFEGGDGSARFWLLFFKKKMGEFRYFASFLKEGF